MLPAAKPRQSWEIFAVLVKPKSLRSLFAQRHGVADSTVQAWGRPAESDEYPTGTGKANPLDQLLRDMRLAYPMFPVEVREIAELVRREVNDLDQADGTSGDSNPVMLAISAMKEHLDVMAKLENFSADDTESLRREWVELETAFHRMKGAVEKLLG